MDDLRDDFGPLNEEQKKALFNKYPGEDAAIVINIIEKFRADRLADPSIDSRADMDTLRKAKAAKAKANEARAGKSKTPGKGSTKIDSTKADSNEDGEEKEVVITNQKQQLAVQEQEASVRCA